MIPVNLLPSNVIFDMGNVLLSYTPEAVVERFCPDETSKALIMKELFQGPEWLMRDRGLISKDELFERVRERIPACYHEALLQCIKGWDFIMQPIPGMREYVREVKASGRKIFVLSNASDDFFTYFNRFLDPQEFDGILVSYQVHIIKPDPEIYRIALERWGLKAEECIFFDDRPVNVKAARAVGMQGEVVET